MKKFFILVLVGLLGFNIQSFSQIDDKAVVPVAVTLNSILRLNIESGGNIEFVFNTLSQYSSGIVNSDQHDTKISIASSSDWDLDMYAEDDQLYGTSIDTAGGVTGNSLELNHIGYWVEIATGASITTTEVGLLGSQSAPAGLENTARTIINLKTNQHNAGDINQNQFIINWECGTQKDGNATSAMNSTSLLDVQTGADRYATNVYFILRSP
jgi:hypothetical protein